MHTDNKPLQRRRAVMKIFEQQDWSSVELLDSWDGEELDELKPILRAEEFETLLDRLGENDEPL